MFGFGSSTAEKVVRRYVASLNARDLAAIADMLHPVARFVDSRGEWIEGRDNLVCATERFFAFEPGFFLTADSIVKHRGEILLRGSTAAVRPELRTDILWRARVDAGKLAFWQSYGPSSSLPLARILGGELAQSGAEGGTARNGGTSFALTRSAKAH